MALQFAANLSTMFTDLPFLDRFSAAHAAGFGLVEFQFPYEAAPGAIAEKLAATRQKAVLFNLLPGNWEAGERGVAALPGREAEFRAGVAQALEYAEALGTEKLHCMAGIAAGNPAKLAKMRAVYLENLAFAAGQCAKAGVTLLIEPINPVSMPGYFLASFNDAAEIINELSGLQSATPRLQFDLFHCAMMGLDIAATIEKHAQIIGHWQIAGVPDRNEPDRGDLDLKPVFNAVKKIDSNAVIGCEYFPLEAPLYGKNWMEMAK